MQLTDNGFYYTFEHKGAAYSIKKEQVTEEKLYDAAEFLTGEAREYVSVETLEALLGEINDTQTDLES